ncbi:MAG: hypothetical protein HZA93_21190 [Verrucomicrobia bacterium]|nr:hypothetical protein [Verrucomicrobiota bacterium]
MTRYLKLCWQGSRWCAACLWSFLLWSGWLFLAILLCLQGYIVSTNELEVPGFLLRELESRLAVSGLRATFGRTSFDPSGRVLIEDARVFLPSYAEPVLTLRAAYVKLDPWALAVGHFEPREMRIIGANWSVPAMLSPSGRAEEILRDLDATLVPRERELDLTQFVARIAGIVVSAHGTLQIPGARETSSRPLPVAEFLAHQYPALCRQIAAVAERLGALEAPSLHLELSPSASRGAIASATLFAAGLRYSAPGGNLDVQARDLRLVTRFPLLGDAPVAARLELTARELNLPFDSTARRVRAIVRGTLHPTRFRYEPNDFRLTAEAVTAAGFTADCVSARLTPGPLPGVKADLVGALFGTPLAVRAETDFAARTARLDFEGAVSPEIFLPLNARLGVDVRQWFNFKTLELHDGVARFGPDWKFQGVNARVAVRDIDAYHVIMEEGRAIVGFDGRRFYSPEAWARIGDNFARGTYDHDLVTRDYRFLLEGQLRPLAISGWFPGGWWENFFKQFEFPAAAPVASVDVIGRWGTGDHSAVFIAADTAGPVIRSGAFDRVRTLLFVRPSYYDGIELRAIRAGREARGTFTYTTDHETLAPRQFDLDVTSTLELALARQVIGPESEAWLGPFAFAQPPDLKLSGRITGAAAPGGAHQSLQIEAKSAGEFRFYGFPLQSVSFAATLHDDVIEVPRIEAATGGGNLGGRAKVWGRDQERRVAFDFSLKGANLGGVTAVLQDYEARRKNTPPAPPGKFVTDKAAVHLDVNVAAEGRFDDPLSFHGAGNAVLQGAELGEVKMLGLLSELIKFTALRFTTARAAFKVDGRRLAFSEVKLTGANSAIEATGDYALDKRELDFKAKVFPLHESGNLIKKTLEVVLSPVTTVVEVRLNGTLDKPAWSLALMPGNLLRALVPGEPAPPPEKAATPPLPGAGPPPAPPKS